jgi:hypothetical protein
MPSCLMIEGKDLPKNFFECLMILRSILIYVLISKPSFTWIHKRIVEHYYGEWRGCGRANLQVRGGNLRSIGLPRKKFQDDHLESFPSKTEICKNTV